MTVKYRIGELPLQRVITDPNQPRKFSTEEKRNALRESLRVDGQLVPILVYEQEDKAVVVEGNSRVELLRELGKTTVLAMVVDKPNTEADLLKNQLIVNTIRSDLNPIDKAVAYSKLMKLENCSQKKLSEIVHQSEATVSETLQVLHFSPELQRKVQRGEISPSAALQLHRSGIGEQGTLTEISQEGSLTRSQIKKRIIHNRGDKTKVNRIAIRQFQANVTITSPAGISLEQYIELLDVLRKEAMECQKKGFNLSTLQRMNADRHSKPAKIQVL